ncbi:MAG: V-type ATP synthase subunit E [Clostridium sp.]
MTGLDKIISQILDDAGKEADGVLEKAQREAEKILNDGKEACKRMEELGVTKQEAEVVSMTERTKSSAELQKRQAVLLAKQQIIADMLDQAYHTLLSKGQEEYFVLIQKMLDKFVLAKQGEIYFSQKDLDRMPPDFESVIEKSAASKGGSLKLIKEAKNIDGGFILVYGGVEENCSFKALLSAQRDELSDKVHEMLFS